MNESQQYAKLCLELLETSRPRANETAFEFSDRVATAKKFLIGILNDQLTVTPVASTTMVDAEEATG